MSLSRPDKMGRTPTVQNPHLVTVQSKGHLRVWTPLIGVNCLVTSD
jgi:hypothetical protein